MLALSQSVGSVPESRDSLKMLASPGAGCSELYFKIRFGIVSGPLDLEMSRFLSNLY